MTTPALPRATLRRPLSSRAVHALVVWVLGLAALLLAPSVRLGAVEQVSSLSSAVLTQPADEDSESMALDDERDEGEESLLTDTLALPAPALCPHHEPGKSPLRRRPPDSTPPPTVDLDPCRKPPGAALALG